jgi:hypothetical protein
MERGCLGNEGWEFVELMFSPHLVGRSANSRSGGFPAAELTLSGSLETAAR